MVVGGRNLRIDNNFQPRSAGVVVVGGGVVTRAEIMPKERGCRCEELGGRVVVGDGRWWRWVVVGGQWWWVVGLTPKKILRRRGAPCFPHGLVALAPVRLIFL